VVPDYRAKFEALARRRGVEAHLCLPDRWPEGGADVSAPPAGDIRGLRVHVLPCRWRGRIGFAHLQGLGALAREIRPDLVYAEEEPYSLAAWQALRAAEAVGARFAFYTWENQDRRYKPPLNWVRKRVLARSALAVAGNRAAEGLLRGWGYPGKILTQPQYGIDPKAFKVGSRPKGPFTVGYFGRLVPEKGVRILFQAAAEAGVRVRIGGRGPQEADLKLLAGRIGLDAEFLGFVPFGQRAGFYRGLHALALPSLTTPKWEEQFGRVLAEAMACGVPCVGSDSGAIPEVLGAAGLVAPEGDAPALARALLRLRDERGLSARLAKAGRARALKLYTQDALVGALARALEGLR
jgi:glycosyltransferase involved in cell wall biosynthesis